MNQTILIKSLILCAFLCIISCDKLENEYYDTPISKEVMSGAVTEDGDSCVDFGWSPDGNTIVYTDGVSFVKKVALSSGYISTLARRTRGGFFEYFSPRITDEAVYYGRKWMGSQPGLPRGAICKISLPDTSAKILQQFDASIAMNMIISDDSKKIACATNDSLLVFDTSGIVLHRISTNLHDVPFCFSQDNATLYIASNFPFFKGLTSFSLIDSSTAAIISGMPNEAGWSVSADSNGVRILIETASTFVLRNLSNGTSKVLWTLQGLNLNFLIHTLISRFIPTVQTVWGSACRSRPLHMMIVNVLLISGMHILLILPLKVKLHQTQRDIPLREVHFHPMAESWLLSPGDEYLLNDSLRILNPTKQSIAF
jgi:hypothetical protein